MLKFRVVFENKCCGGGGHLSQEFDIQEDEDIISWAQSVANKNLPPQCQGCYKIIAVYFVEQFETPKDENKE